MELHPKRHCKCEAHYGDEKWHGTSNGYNRHYCRCQPCKDAHAACVRNYYADPENHERLMELQRIRSRRQYANSINRQIQYRENSWRSVHGIIGMTVERLDALIRIQRDRCAICRRQFVIPKNWHLPYEVDHDHAITDRLNVRGLLCHSCNNALVSVDSGEQSPSREQSAYLRRFAWLDKVNVSLAKPADPSHHTWEA